MNDSLPPPQKLSVPRVLRETILIPVQHLREFAVALVLPALLIVVLFLGWNFAVGIPNGVLWTLYVFYGAAFTALAVACHRLVLLGPTPATLAPKLQWGWRETRFLGWVSALAAIFVAVRLVSLFVVANVPNVASGWLKAADYLSFVLGTYVLARLSLVLPATAVEEKTNLKEAWTQSAGNGWRLALVIGAFPWMMDYGVGLMYRESATVPEVVLLVILSVIVSVLGVIALSLSYQDLTNRQ